MAPLEKISLSTNVLLSKGREKTSAFFYEGGGRSKVLNQIHHCVRFSPGVIVLTGPTGSGRSLLIQTLVKSFKEDESDLCVLSEESTVLETEEELYRILAEGFGLEQKSVEMMEDLVDRVQHFIRVGLRGKRNLLIAIDDAKQHSPDVLEALLQLVGSNKGLNLLLSGETSLLETLKQFHVQSIMVHQIALRPLLTEEAFNFLHQYLVQKGVTDESALNRKKLDELMSRTGGNISLLVREAQQLVIDMHAQRKRSHAGLPIVHMIALVLVITITILAFLYYPTSTQNPPAVELPQVVDETPELSPHKMALEKIPEKTISGDVVDVRTSSLSSIPLMIGAETPQLKNEIDLPNIDAPVSEPVYTSQEQELLNAPANNVTLQVSSLSSEKMVKRFIDQCAPSERIQLSYYRRGEGDKTSYVVLYGSYPNKLEAMNAQKELPAMLKKSAPWPRSLADIKRELRQRKGLEKG